MSTGVVLFTRDLRVHDNPTLAEAARRHDRIVPLFVLDTAILDGDYNRPNRAAFLSAALADLDGSLRELGAGLVIRRGRVADEVRAVAGEVAADAVHVAADASGYAQNREKRLHDALDCELVTHGSALFVVDHGEITPTGSGAHGAHSAHMAVFSAYHRRWTQVERRSVLRPPRALHMPRISTGTPPSASDICRGDTSSDLVEGGESAGRRRLAAWLRADAARYADVHDDLGADATSRLSPYLHFGCLSPLEVISRKGVPDEFVRQVCWRDFHAQVLAAKPASTTRDYRPRGDRWRRSEHDLAAWREGRTGLPLVDAGMRQLLAQGWMHNRARLIVAHILVKTLYLDWRLGAQHFVDLLVDGDVANNTMNWQWVAGTGTDSRFNRTVNVDTQARKYDPGGDYVRRWVPELADVEGAAVHRPWTLPRDRLATLDYPDPIVDVAEGNRRFLHARGK